MRPQALIQRVLLDWYYHDRHSVGTITIDTQSRALMAGFDLPKSVRSRREGAAQLRRWVPVAAAAGKARPRPARRPAIGLGLGVEARGSGFGVRGSGFGVRAG